MTAAIAGGLYLVTFVTSIPALALKGPALHDPEFILGSGEAGGVLWGGLLEVILAAACVGTAVVLFPIARRQNEAAALGFVAARILESALIVGGVASVLAIVTLRDGSVGAVDVDAASMVAAGQALVALHDWAFLLGPGIIPAVNALCLGYVMHRARLVPRILPVLAFVGAPLLFASAAACFFGMIDQVSAVAGIAALPIAAWELSLGVWLLVRGFRTEGLDRLGLTSRSAAEA